ncbi:rod shape-determining protein RodA [Spirulina sp. CCNP1310]|uniref:rod shape-determining protein RodA n=1 Tax=Spirulina sp. CCNP1310 TaxID=3110249 RepID=UPI002B20EEF0|nr:rod shape-determining protein RodA [Spirulina sp. CCNP1310]MEA5419514.1 rod shape-determining protein RodA [Spirulina sp. CCNP1310]
MLQRTYKEINEWRNWWSGWQNMDFSLLLLVMGLTLFGGLIIHTTELRQGIIDWWQHWVIGAVGLVLALIIARCRYEFLIQWHWITYAITNIALITVTIIGHTAKGAQSWLRIGGLNLQPSEFAKVALIITMAALLHERPASTLNAIFRVLAVTCVPWALVFLEPDLGTSLVFGAITLGMLYWGNAHPGWLLLMASPLLSAVLYNLYLPGWLIWVCLMCMVAWFTLPWNKIGTLIIFLINGVAGAAGGFLWNLLEDYQKARLLLFLNPEQDPLGGGYHLIQSRIAIGAGELWGRGLFNGTQTQLDFIPEQHTDFIFCAVGEELGFIGAISVLIVFWLVCLRLIIIAQNAKENFGSLLAVGVLSMIAFQVFVNIGMTVGLSPITGLPLPWLSYGRSALLANFLAIGLVESVANHRPRRHFN